MKGQDRTGFQSVFFQTLYFLTVVCETIVGVVLFFLWSIVWGWSLFQGFFSFFLYLYLGLIIVTFFLNSTMFFTRAVSSIKKILLTGFHSLLTMTSLVIISISPQFHHLLKDLYIVPIISFMLFIFISYLTQLSLSKAEIYEIINSETENVRADIKELLSKQRILAEKIFYSLLLSLFLWGLTIGISIISKGTTLSFFIQHKALFSFLILFIYLIGLAIGSYISIKPLSFLKKPVKQLFGRFFTSKETEKETA